MDATRVHVDVHVTLDACSMSCDDVAHSVPACDASVSNVGVSLCDQMSCHPSSSEEHGVRVDVPVLTSLFVSVAVAVVAAVAVVVAVIFVSVSDFVSVAVAPVLVLALVPVRRIVIHS